ncbi:uncharacterized protein AMSG_06366 [Thecamonas trahens ATCC 50062]|uniref:Uncharacterized protein n=1 Tax=Thecamonas trahens ATCC 50062 TaxID=461836 RepID=A0A0L0DCZ8_THETB|nr:hypothetical protein AMSG_06366 [Thecamonas trahens ATCC 50062]KNC50217.1 hypothetical protein AMSG_06366 [Thecamonas trahens ATCC 50062]|eukprot:XP_013757051.1 hypothetical protein AMSG_06366 [Thecamonas trahens ATCC 50062]
MGGACAKSPGGSRRIEPVSSSARATGQHVGFSEDEESWNEDEDSMSDDGSASSGRGGSRSRERKAKGKANGKKTKGKTKTKTKDKDKKKKKKKVKMLQGHKKKNKQLKALPKPDGVTLSNEQKRLLNIDNSSRHNVLLVDGDVDALTSPPSGADTSGTIPDGDRDQTSLLAPPARPNAARRPAPGPPATNSTEPRPMLVITEPTFLGMDDALSAKRTPS